MAVRSCMRPGIVGLEPCSGWDRIRQLEEYDRMLESGGSNAATDLDNSADILRATSEAAGRDMPFTCCVGHCCCCCCCCCFSHSCLCCQSCCCCSTRASCCLCCCCCCCSCYLLLLCCCQLPSPLRVGMNPVPSGSGVKPYTSLKR